MEKEEKLWRIVFTPYTECIFPVSTLNYTVVWPRLLSSPENDTSALFVGYSNLLTEYGDEGVEILYDTPKCSRTVFFSGDELNYDPENSGKNDSGNTTDNKCATGKHTECWAPKDRVDQNKYNHLYGDFRNLHKDFPYLIDSNFFEYIFVGDRTFIYFSHIKIITDFCSMLKKDGSLLIALNESSLVYYYGPYLDNYLGTDYDFEFYFYSVPAQNDQIFVNILFNYRSIFCDFRYNSVDQLEKELSEKIPFVTNFIEQNNASDAPLHNGKEPCILKIIKR